MRLIEYSRHPLSKRLLIPGVMLLTIGLTACSDDDSEVTYRNSVEPVFYRSCVGCHKNGGIAPFSLLREENGYANAVSYRYSIKQQLIDKTMPPFLATNDGSCQKFKHDIEVSNREIDDISTWVESVTPDTADEPVETPPQPVALASIDNPDLEIMMPDIYQVDPTQTDEYRCFLIDPGLSQDKLVSAFEVIPGNAGVVHHVILFSIYDTADIKAAHDLDVADPKLGYQCFGGPGVNNAGVVAGWAPGTGATTYPNNTGIRIASHSYTSASETISTSLILQVHYNTANALDNYSDQTKMKLKLIDPTITAEAYMPLHYISGFQLPPNTSGNPNTVVTETIKVGDMIGRFDVSIRALGVFPHMHTLGQKLHDVVNKGGRDECLVDVKQWDFEWQRPYFYENPTGIVLNPNDELTLNCTFQNNTGAIVTEGDKSSQEMCLDFYYITPVLF